MNIRAILAASLLGVALSSLPMAASAGGYVSIQHGFGLSTYRPDRDHARPEQVHRYSKRFDRKRLSRHSRHSRYGLHPKSRNYGQHRSYRYPQARRYYGYPYTGGISIYYGSGGSSIRYSVPIYSDRHRW